MLIDQIRSFESHIWNSHSSGGCEANNTPLMAMAGMNSMSD
jgi:hypothetical protein